MAAGEDDSAATNAAGKTVGKPCRLVVYNRAGEVVGAGVSAQSFMDFKRHSGKRTAVIVELDCGEEVFVETCTLFKRLPRGATYRARRARYRTGSRVKLVATTCGSKSKAPAFD